MRRSEVALLLSLFAAHAALAQAPARSTAPRAPAHAQSRLLVSAAWLAAHLGSAGVVIVHVGRTDAAYRAGHIPGARFLPVAAVATTVRGVPNEFPPREEMAAAFRDLGVGNAGRIVLYGDDAGLEAARAFVALDLLGHSGRAALLDGGLARWVAEQRPLETAAPAVSPRPFTVRWRPDRVATAEWVRAHLRDRSVLLVDARPAGQYGGAEPPCPPGRACAQIPLERRGHLPGAKSLWWMDNLASRDDPVLKPADVLRAEWEQRTGADRPGVRTVVTYCLSGMQASYDYFVARYLGHRDVRLYDGSFAEWAALTPASAYPMERAGP
jgi:thiosulfate/3-mercaptopyruvate sulfurtransferase